MQDHQNDIRYIAIKKTIFIFICSLPFLLLLALPSLFDRNEFTRSWLRIPAQYPFSFSISLFVSLSLGAATLWIFRKQEQDFGLLPIIMASFLGCCLNIFFVIFLHSFSNFICEIILVFIVLYLAFPLLIICFTLLVFSLISIIYSVKIFFPFVFIYLSCFLFTVRKPVSASKRLINVLPILGLITLSYLFLTVAFTKPTIGAIIPVEMRNIWGQNIIGYNFQRAIGELGQCEQFSNYIGSIKAAALAEGKNYSTLSFRNNYSRLTIELVGEKGTAIIQQTCNRLGCSAPDTTKQPPVRVYSPSGIKDIEYFQICSN